MMRTEDLVIGYIEDGIICIECGSEDMEPALAIGYPDGFTCADCGKVIH